MLYLQTFPAQAEGTELWQCSGLGKGTTEASGAKLPPRCWQELTNQKGYQGAFKVSHLMSGILSGLAFKFSYNPQRR